MADKIKLAIVISHPIQHFCPQYASFAKNERVTLKVFFASKLGLARYIDKNFKQEISWGNLALDKFQHEFLNGDKVLQADSNLDAPVEAALQNFDPDIVFTYGYYQKLQRRTYKWAVNNKKLLAYISDSELRHHESKLKRTLKYFFLKRYFKKPDFFLTVGNANESYYNYYGVPSNKFQRMHYPIDREFYESRYPAKAILRKQQRDLLKLADNDFAMIVVGKLVDWKNQDHIISAMQLLEKENIKTHLLVAGSGENMEQWKNHAAQLQFSKAHFLGFVNIEALPSYYAAADLYVHPARMEPHSVAISEAVMMGLPVILSDRCGSYGETDDVQTGRNGYAYPFGNIPELAKLIKGLMADRKKQIAFGEYSHSIAGKFQLQSHKGILDALLESVKKNEKFNSRM